MQLFELHVQLHMNFDKILSPTMLLWFSIHSRWSTLHAYKLDHFDLWPDELLFKCANKSIKGICGQFTCLRFQFFL